MLVFKNTSNQVYDSLNSAMKLLSYIPDRKDGFLKNYILDDSNNLYINDDLVDSNQLINILPLQIGLQFRKNILFLKKNGINGAYFQLRENDWFFLYRYSIEETFNDSRDIIVANKFDLMQIRSNYQIVDSIHGIYLMAPKEAIIR
ncbi:MAG: hypothetical protein DI598_03235 [Pseudopedobacter saltans]|uniref:Uncharacterized protein n=1 Tax=Pseudopedobacter saltans TaxID=151895 RepID=A0A2W5F5W6_9SPHI|nr:MAG: hypothetical protein DI598_03235 [Pseudopedobacter saltans]